MHNEYNKRVCKFIKESKVKFKANKESFFARISGSLLPNEFATITISETNPEKRYYEYVKNVKKVLGYNDERFNTELLLKAIDPLDRPLAVEFAFVAHSLLKYDIGLNNESEFAYFVDFIIRQKDNCRIRLRRCCWVLSLENTETGGKRLTQMDLWTKLKDITTKKTDNPNLPVNYGFISDNTEMVNKAYQLFYDEWIKVLNLGNGFSEIQMKTINLFKQGLTAKEIAKKLKKGTSHINVSSYRNEVTEKAKKLIYKTALNRNINKELKKSISTHPLISGTQQTINFIEKFSLFPKNKNFN